MKSEASFVFNPTAKFLTVVNSIDERVCKIKGILNCVMVASEFISNSGSQPANGTIYHALWSIEGYLEELETLCRHLTELPNNSGTNE